MTTNHSMPARVLADDLTPVSRAPQSLPLANTTCCILVSFESGLATTSGPPRTCAVVPTSSFQHPLCPLNRSVVSSFK